MTLFCNSKLDEINVSLCRHYKQVNGLSLSRGQLGISLFFYNYYRFTSNEEHLVLSREILGNSFGILTGNNTRSGNLFRELIDLGKYLLLLFKEKQVDDSVNEVLQEIDEVLLAIVYDQLQRRDLDPVTGAIAAGYYFIERFKNMPSEAIGKWLMEVRAVIEQMILEEDGYRIKGAGNDQEVQLGISHGVSGILLFLARLHGIGLGSNKALLTKGLNYLYDQQQDIGNSRLFFPIKINTPAPASMPIHLAYGDLGVAWSIFEISKIISDDAKADFALHIFSYYANPENSAAYRVLDANVLYGAAGIAALFKRMSLETNNTLFDEATVFWLNKTLELLSVKNDYAGFEPYWNAIYPETYTSVSEGITGIGLAMMYIMQPTSDFLFSIVNYN